MNPARRIERTCWVLMRRLHYRTLRKRLRNSDFSILSSNCVGGVILHELGQRFNSPTVNLYMLPADYIKFLEDLDGYLNTELRAIEAQEDCPVGALDDVRLYFTHYASFADAKAKWEERKTRIRRDNLYVMMVERDGCTDEDLRRFDALPYRHKVCFTMRERPDIACACHIPDSEEDGQVRDLTAYKDRRRIHRWIDDFDFVSFLNDR